jgi:hypothetical protein
MLAGVAGVAGVAPKGIFLPLFYSLSYYYFFRGCEIEKVYRWCYTCYTETLKTPPEAPV